MTRGHRRIAPHGSAAFVVADVTWRYLRRCPRQAAWLAIWSVVEVAPTFAFGRAMAGATNAFLAGRGHLAVGLDWLGVLVAAAVIGSVGSRMAYRPVAAIVEPMRDDLVRRIVTGAVRRCVDHGEPPDTGACARISHQAEIVRDSFGGLLSALRTFVFVAGGALAGLATLLPMALPLVAGPLLAGLLIFAGLVGPLARRQREYVLTEEAVAVEGIAVMAALRDITACGGQEQAYATLARQVDAQVRATRDMSRMAAARSMAISVGGWAPVPLLLAATPWLLRGGANAGQIIGALAYLAGGLQPALRILVQGLGSSGVRMAVTLERITEREAPPPASPEPPALAALNVRTVRAPAPGNRRDVELRGVTFGYGPHVQPVISDLSLVIPDGDHLAVVGPSGVGKSTLAGLIAGMLAPRAGEISLGGIAPHRLSGAELAAHRVLIPQEAYVFDGTLAENLAYLNPHARRAEIRAASAAVGLRELVTRLGGYDAVLDPAALSAGERQLIALARAYLSPARLALLDEATCHLDPVAEAKAERAFAAREGTLVVIAHRMSSALRARRVLVLDGDRAEIGTHDRLLARSALYRDLVGYWETRQNGASRAGRSSGGSVGQSQPEFSAMRIASS